MIEFQNIGKSYGGVRAVEGLNLHIELGELVVLIGPSGSGKSTALKMINRMVDHDQGRILFEGREIYSFDVRDLRRRMGYAIQSVGLFPHWTVERNIATVPHLLGWSKESISQRVTELLTLFDMAPELFRQRYPHQLSGGQQQRVGVARALAADPAVLLMDEPFGALDPVTRTALQLELKRVHQTSGKTIVLVTHDIDEALLLADRIVLMNQGQIVQVATPLELLSSPASDFVLDFVGRSDLGIKLLSLKAVEPLVRHDPAPPGSPTLPQTASLREAVAILAAQGASVLSVLNAQQQPVGSLYASDIFVSHANTPA
ncbi:ABC transporter ATP-binding protein [Rhodoferax antarcticus]|uniref:Putative osmoprotectant uptake ABC transporter family protein n=1 Tax=Rhodoferax antarcticus ANT.BR TaxID=1111071 RepID=A0A1Q8YDH0_9BURK|nr:ABC transporter ATP-binding protein [Rhodoferax antarcticus]APW45971.1 ATP-binding protein [Rhodoferax antarcticus]OLP06096.1 putative osmoprotectant uptake ABC transporter family protein [Rhodoferax antarcticus ANT.BR]